MARNSKPLDEDEDSIGASFSPGFGGGDDDDDEAYELGDEEFDLSEAKEYVFEPLPAGTYDAVVIDAEYALSAAKKPRIKWIFGTEIEGDDGKPHVRRLFMYDSMQPKQLGQVKAHVRILNPDFDLKKFRPARAGEDFKDCECRLRLAIGKPYQGRRNNEVKEVLPPNTFAGAFLPSGA